MQRIWAVLMMALLATVLVPAAAGADSAEGVSITIESPRADEILDFEVIPSGFATGVTVDATVRVAMRHDDTGLWVDDHYSLSDELFLWPMFTSDEIWPDGKLHWGYGDVIRIFEGNYTMYAIVRDANGAARDMQSYSAEWFCYECGPDSTAIDSPEAGDVITQPLSANGTWYKWNAAVEPIEGMRVGIRFDDGSFYAGPGERSRQITWLKAKLCCPDSTNSGTWSFDQRIKLPAGDYTLIAQGFAEDWQANPAQTPFTVERTGVLGRG